MCIRDRLTEQIDLLQRSQNTTSLQLDALLRERSAALYDMMDELEQMLDKKHLPDQPPKPTVVAVSYTHLDVYKRQTIG